MSETEASKNSEIPGGWLDWANRTTAILAVIAALSSARWGASNLQAILEQGKVNDTWAYYQSDSLKEHSAEQARDMLQALSAVQQGSSQPAGHSAAVEAIAKKFADDADREAAKRNQQMKDAQRYEASRDKMVERGFWFEISFAALQLGVVLCTVASGAKHKSPWLLAMAFGIFGLLVLINGFHPFYHAPKTWYESVSKDMAYEAPAPPGPANAP